MAAIPTHECRNKHLLRRVGGGGFPGWPALITSEKKYLEMTVRMRPSTLGTSCGVRRERNECVPIQSFPPGHSSLRSMAFALQVPCTSQHKLNNTAPSGLLTGLALLSSLKSKLQIRSTHWTHHEDSPQRSLQRGHLCGDGSIFATRFSRTAYRSATLAST